jgi:predicted esterase
MSAQAFTSYETLFNTAMALYREQKYPEVLDLLTTEGQRFPEHASMILYLRSCMAARAGLPEHAIQILTEAVDRGFWYGAETMRQSPAWINLQGDPEFERLAAICIDRQVAAVQDPKIFTLAPDSDDPLPVFFALHGNGDSGLNTLYGWNSVIDLGWLLVAPQSAQAESSDGYIWNDQPIALRQLVDQFTGLRQEYTIDEKRVIGAGFSMGGETVLRLALTGPVPMKGFLLLAPGGPTIDDAEEWLPEIRQAKGRGLRGYVLIGENDDIVPQAQIRRLVDLLNKHGVPCQLEVVPGLRHEYPRNAEPLLQRALAFIEGTPA